MSSEYEKTQEIERLQNKQTKKQKIEQITLGYTSNFSFMEYGKFIN